MKLISPTGNVKTFKSRQLLKEWLETSFDKYDESVLKHPFNTTIYWDICPYAQDVGNGKEHFVWNSDQKELDNEQYLRAQEI